MSDLPTHPPPSQVENIMALRDLVTVYSDEEGVDEFETILLKALVKGETTPLPDSQQDLLLGHLVLGPRQHVPLPTPLQVPSEGLSSE